MKETQTFYTSPKVEEIEIEACNMLCTSTQQAFGIKDDEGYTEGSW